MDSTSEKESPFSSLYVQFYFLARPWPQGKKDYHPSSNRYQSFCKLMVIELNWVKCNLVCIWSDGRAAWLKKKKWIRFFSCGMDSGLCSGTWILDSNRFIVALRILWAVFRIPKARIPDSTMKNFSNSRIRFRFLSSFFFYINLIFINNSTKSTMQLTN